ncbi:MAG: arginine repressor [Clostridia bacterium]|nr:arginine repressor [Clostridia bacterium]
MKQDRHSMILELIDKNSVETQEDLANLLKENGYNVTQATVSRDIKQLRLIKVSSDGGVYKYAAAKSASGGEVDEKQRIILVQSVKHVECAQNIVVVSTLSGMAQAAASVLDCMKIKEIVGSIAGDDTIMCVTKTNDSAKAVYDKIKSLL